MTDTIYTPSEDVDITYEGIDESTPLKSLNVGDCFVYNEYLCMIYERIGHVVRCFNFSNANTNSYIDDLCVAPVKIKISVWKK